MRELTMKFALALFLASVLVAGSGLAWAREDAGRSYYGFEGKRSRKLDFEDDYIETMGKRPLDSLTELSEADKRRKHIHLYRKRSGFGGETAETIQQVRYN